MESFFETLTLTECLANELDPNEMLDFRQKDWYTGKVVLLVLGTFAN